MSIDLIIVGVILFICAFMGIYTMVTNKDLPDNDDKKEETNWFNK